MDYIKYKRKFVKAKERISEKKQDYDVLQKCLDESRPAPQISSSRKDSYFWESIKAINDGRGKDEGELSLKEIVDYSRDHSVVFDTSIPSLRNALASTIRKTTKQVGSRRGVRSYHWQ